MKHKLFSRLFLILPFLIALGAVSKLRAQDPETLQFEVDARGPIHEAFAQPHAANPMPNPLVEKQPPDPLPEEPAEEKPAGNNVQWIPGYWHWDADRSDFIWVSGFWRDVPEGRRWIMGYWAETPDGNRWVSGHWAAQQERDYQYVPEPPENQDVEPPAELVQNDAFYIPGSYFYGSDGYYYRDGYWSSYMPGRVWVPAQYIWTPYGYSFCSGYWDYPIYNRGLLFAPAYFNSPIWRNPGFRYRPLFALALRGLLNSLFVGRGYNHYYFGDFYSRSYLNRGIYPWFWNSRSRYDPIWGYERWANRNNVRWSVNQRANYVARVNGTRPLPPRTLAAQNQAIIAARTNVRGSGVSTSANAVARAAAIANIRSQQTVVSLADLRSSGQRLERVTSQQRTAQLQSAQKLVTQAQRQSRAAPRTASAMPPVRRPSASLRTTPTNRAGIDSRITSPNRPSVNRTPQTRPNQGSASVTPRSSQSNRPAPPTRLSTPSQWPSVTQPRIQSPSRPPVTQPRIQTPSRQSVTQPRIQTPSRPSVSPPRSQPSRPSYNPPRSQPSRPSVSPPRGSSRPSSPPPRGNSGGRPQGNRPKR